MSVEMFSNSAFLPPPPSPSPLVAPDATWSWRPASSHLLKLLPPVLANKASLKHPFCVLKSRVGQLLFALTGVYRLRFPSCKTRADRDVFSRLTWVADNSAASSERHHLVGSSWIPGFRFLGCLTESLMVLCFLAAQRWARGTSAQCFCGDFQDFALLEHLGRCSANNDTDVTKLCGHQLITAHHHMSTWWTQNSMLPHFSFLKRSKACQGTNSNMQNAILTTETCLTAGRPCQALEKHLQNLPHSPRGVTRISVLNGHSCAQLFLMNACILNSLQFFFLSLPWRHLHLTSSLRLLFTTFVFLSVLFFLIITPILLFLLLP